MMMTRIKAKAQAARTAPAAAKAAEARLRQAAAMTESELLESLGSAPGGLTEAQAEAARAQYGPNSLPRPKEKTALRRLLEALADPFSLVLLLLAAVPVLTDVVLAPAGRRDWATVTISTGMVVLSAVLRAVQEGRSSSVARQLSDMIHTTAAVQREGVRQELPMEELVAGDIVRLAAGDMVPADLRILSARDLFIAQSALTGESEPVEKSPAPTADPAAALTGIGCLAFQGSTVISGSARAVVVAVGSSTIFGSIARTMGDKPPKTAFDKGLGAV